MSYNFGALRVVRVRPPANAKTDLHDRYPTGWLPEERLVHLLVRRETTIGRALSNDVILIDPTVSREHARLVLDEYGWHVTNLTAHNIVRVNGRLVPSGMSLPMQPQDILVLGSTMLQLIAPQVDGATSSNEQYQADEPTHRLTPLAQAEQAMPLPSTYTSIAEWERRPTPDAQRDYPRPLQSRTPAVPPLVHPAQLLASQVPSNGHRASQQPQSLPTQSDPELRAHPWQEDEEENVLGPSITMQFALPQQIGIRTRWLIAGAGLAILLTSAIITIVLNSLIGISAFTRSGPASVLEALFIPLIPALGINLLVNFIDRYEREPWYLRLAAFLWGAVIAIPPSLFIELNVDAILQHALGPNAGIMASSFLQGLNAGVTEETIKGLGLLLLFIALRDQFDNVTDGIVYGALIGGGFAMVENFVYFAENGKNFLVLLIVGRVILGWLSHSTFTICFGAALGYVRHTRVRWRQIVIPLLGFFASITLHTVFDFVDFFASKMALASPNNPSVAFFSLTAIIGDYIPPFVAQVIILYILIKALAHEGAVIREFLADEVSRGVVRVDEYVLLQNSFQRTKQERRVLRLSGVKQWLHVKALYQTEIGLAFRKWHVSMGDKPKLGYRQPEDAYRQRIKRLRQEIIAAEARRDK
jgi:RsiW-degrading membrane proteinase PrsW (M82 family)